MYSFPFPSILPLIEALGWTFLHSLWIGAVIWMALRFYQTKVSNQKPARHYKLLLLGQFLLISGTLIAFFLSYEKPGEVYFSGQYFPAYPEAPAVSVEEASFSHTFTAFIHQQAPWLGLLWVLGVLVLSLKWLAGWSYMHWLKKKASLLQDYEIEQQVKRIARGMGLNEQIEIRLSDSLFGPCTLGFWSPVILLPASLLTGLSPEQLYGILAHEMAHIKRHDYLINIFQSMLDILFFYHPAQYWMSKHSREAREQCCDDMAIEATGNRMMYARALAEVAGAQLKPLSPATAFQEGKSQLLVRIQRLFGAYSARPKTRLAGIGWAGLLVLALGSAYWPVVHAQGPELENDAVIAIADWEEGEEEAQDRNTFATYNEGETDIASEETAYDTDVNLNLEGLDETLDIPEIGLNLEGLDKLNIPELRLSLASVLDTPPPVPPMPPMPPMPEMPDMSNLPPMPPLPPMPAINFDQAMSPKDSVALEAWGEKMEVYGEQMEAWGEQFGSQWEAWGKKFEQKQAPVWEEWGAKMEAWGEEFGEKFGSKFEEKFADKMKAKNALEQVQRAKERAMEMEGERAIEYAERARERSREAAERARERVERARERSQEARERAQEMAERERFRNSSVVDRTQEIVNALREDGYINANTKKIKIKVKENKITVNGEQVSGADEAKYRRLFWPDVCANCTSEMTISN